MIWLAHTEWAWLVIAALLGALITWVLLVRKTVHYLPKEGDSAGESGDDVPDRSTGEIQ